MVRTGWVVATRVWGVTPSCPLASGRGLRALREISSTGSFCANKQSSRRCWEVPEEVRLRTALGCPQLFAVVLSSIFRLRRCFSRVSFRIQSSSFFSTGRIRLGHPLCSGHPAWGSLLPGSRTIGVLSISALSSPVGAPAPHRNLGGRQNSAPHLGQVRA